MKPSPVVNLLNGGSVTLVQATLSDSEIVEIARITTRNIPGIKHRPEKALLKYMLEHDHSSPFEFPDLIFQIHAPLFVYNQWFRHRTQVLADDGLLDDQSPATYIDTVDSRARMYHNQQQFSGRYAPYPDEFYVPEHVWKQSEYNRQGASEAEVDNPDGVRGILNAVYTLVRDARERLMSEFGVAREQARIVTPLAQYSTWYFKQNLWNLLHWLELRRPSDAQSEIRLYARAVEGFVAHHYPLTYHYWVDIVEGCRLNATDLTELKGQLDGCILAPGLARKLRL